MAGHPLVQLGTLGQSPWLDYITRDLLVTGELQRLIAEDGLRGMTTNPTIFEKAVAGSDRYDADIRALADSRIAPAEIIETLAVADVRAACDAFLPLYRSSVGRDGFVSIEVSPALAHDADGTALEARRLWEAVSRPNVMIKIPGTQAALPAITRCLSRGINVNVTLLFSVARHRQVMEAYLTGLERRRVRREPIAGVASVASFFVSRLDTMLDPLLDASRDAAARGLRGTIAIANAMLAYTAFQETFRGPRWDVLAGEGAGVQRPLWASTSTKDPTLPDVYYVEALVAPDTVTTLPPETLAAYGDHGRPEVRITPHAVVDARQRLAALAGAGFNLEDVTRTLETEGVQKFSASFTALSNGVRQKAVALSGAS
jgi:transaldolase